MEVEIDEEIGKQSNIESKPENNYAEWVELHKWVIKFRNDNNMCPPHFLKFCDINDNFYNRQLISEHGFKMSPSRSDGTKGLSVIEGIRHIRHLVDTNSLSRQQFIFLKSMEFIN
jgi:hypothetical protein